MYPKRKLLPEFILTGIAFLLVLIVLFVSLSTFFSPSNKQPQEQPGSPSSHLTAAEQSFSQMTPQTPSASQTGTLVVTTNVAKAWVTIDQPHQVFAEVRTDPVDPSLKPAPTYYTPFVISGLREGDHTLTVSKPNYVAQDIRFTVKKDHVTRIHADLVPVQ